jgi:branched-chain amino acid aminotransferase
VSETLAALLDERAYLRLMVTRGAGEIDLHPSAADEPRLIVIVKPLKLPEPLLYRDGVRLSLVDWRRNGPGHVPASVKSGNYLSSVMAVAAARRRGAYEALLCGPDGGIAEGASSNLFFVRGGRVQTPPLSLGLLPGITRQVVLDLFAAAGQPVEEATLAPPQLGQVEEAFLTSSVRGVVPVVAVDETIIGGGRPGPVTRDIQERYGRLIGEPPPLFPAGAG